MRSDSEKDRRLIWKCKLCHMQLYKATNTGQGRVTPKLLPEDKNKIKKDQDKLNQDVSTINVKQHMPSSSVQLNNVNLAPVTLQIDSKNTNNQDAAVAPEIINIALQNSFELLPTDDDNTGENDDSLIVEAMNRSCTDNDDSHILTKDDISEKSFSSQSEEKMTRSYDFSTGLAASVKEMEDEIAQLKSERDSTENQLEEVILENNALKRQIKANKGTELIKINFSPITTFKCKTEKG
ncbi:hypothetical protein O0L34_g18672 [Tuta absoluta]|nr:hypothetical protein O0L34_g18672 [Tuta absoluta]